MREEGRSHPPCWLGLSCTCHFCQRDGGLSVTPAFSVRSMIVSIHFSSTSRKGLHCLTPRFVKIMQLEHAFIERNEPSAVSGEANWDGSQVQ